MSSTLKSPSPSGGRTYQAKITRGHSCVLCRRRKVRCDGERPCRNCQKSKADCVASDIVPARRKPPNGDDLVGRLRRAEEALNKAGLKIEDDDRCAGERIASEVDGKQLTETREVTVPIYKDPTITEAKLIAEEGQSRYMEASVWGNVSSEIREDAIHLLQHASEEEIGNATDNKPAFSDPSGLLFGRLMSSTSLILTHPSPVQAFRLWQVFLNNVNPVTKIIHAPTTQELLLQAIGDVGEVSPSLEALMFATYHSAIVSIDDKACQTVLGLSRVVALAKYSAATQQALINAKLLRTSNLMVLQALTLYLLSIRQFTDQDTLWMLCGIAIKIAQRMGLHRESASGTISILEAEIRRRVWWQIWILEGRSSFFSGSPTTSIVAQFPSRFLNVNDSDLLPSMRQAPPEQAAITEMLNCCIAYETGQFIYHHIFKDGNSTTSSSNEVEQLASKLHAVDELESSLKLRYLCYCDFSNPLHYLADVVVRASLSKMRLRLYASPRSPDSPPQSQAHKDAAFGLSLTVLGIDNEWHSGDGKVKLKGFLWHARAFFPLEAFIYTLSELRIRTTGTEVDTAWQLVDCAYLNHDDEILRDIKNKLWVAVGNLCLKAWEQRIKGLRSQKIATMMPACVRELYVQRGVKDCVFQESQATTGMDFATQTESSLAQNVPMFDFDVQSTYLPFDTGDTGAMDWEYWQTLFDDSGVPLLT